MDEVVVYTDGACSGNPGPGGWAAVLVWRGVVKEISGGEERTTNQRMELTAAIKGLEALRRKGCRVVVKTDSQYLVGGMNGWKRWANRDLWARLDELARAHEVRFEWIRGHTGDRLNERADYLARSAIERT